MACDSDRGRAALPGLQGQPEQGLGVLLQFAKVPAAEPPRQAVTVSREDHAPFRVPSDEPGREGLGDGHRLRVPRRQENEQPIHLAALDLLEFPGDVLGVRGRRVPAPVHVFAEESEVIPGEGVLQFFV